MVATHGPRSASTISASANLRRPQPQLLFPPHLPEVAATPMPTVKVVTPGQQSANTTSVSQSTHTSQPVPSQSPQFLPQPQPRESPQSQSTHPLHHTPPLQSL